MRYISSLVLVLVTFLALTSTASAREVFVKYRGVVDVDNGHFLNLSEKMKPSSFVQEMFYDRKNNYLLVRLNGTFYHYCNIPVQEIDSWLASKSLGRYYNAAIKGHYDCRVNPVPIY